MKKTVFVVFALLIISCASLFAEQADNGLVITENKNISVIGSNNRNKWLVRVKDRDVSFMLVDMASHKMANFPVDGQPIVSAKFIMLPYVSDSMIDRAGSLRSTPMAIPVMSFSIFRWTRILQMDTTSPRTVPVSERQLRNMLRSSISTVSLDINIPIWEHMNFLGVYR